MKKHTLLLLTLLLWLTSAAGAGAATLTWTGSAGVTSDVWDVGTTANWLNGGSPAVFNNYDEVTFDDLGSTNPVVNLTATVMPAAVTVKSASDYTFTNSGGGGLGGSGTLTQLGNGQLNLQSANTYSGGTTISTPSVYGVIQLFDANALGSGVMTMNGIGGLVFGADIAAGNGGLGVTNDLVSMKASANNALFFAGKLSGKISGSGKLSWTGFPSGSVTLSGDNSGWVGGFNFGGPITLYLGHTNALGRGILTMDAGTLPVIGAAIDLSGGSGVANAIVISGNSLTINLTNDLFLSGFIGGSGNLVKIGGATLILGGNNSFTGNLTNCSGTLKVGKAAALGAGVLTMNGGKLGTVAPVTLGNNIVLAADGEVANTNDLTLSGVISGTGGLTKSGSGMLSLLSANTYTGGTTINAPSGSVLQLNSPGICLLGDITNNSGRVLLGGNEQIADTAILTFGTGATGRLDLQGFNETIGGVRDSGGTGIRIVEAAVDGLGGKPATLTLNVSGAGAYNFGGYVRDAAGTTGSILSITKSGTGYQTFGADAGQVSYSGPTVINAGVLEFSGANSVANNSAITLNGGSVQFSGGGTRTNTITGAGNLIKAGANTLTLSGANTFTGSSTVSNGTLLVNGSIASSSTVVKTGATLGGSGTINGSASVATGGNLAAGSSGVGTLTITNDLTLADSTLVYDITNAATADKIIVGGNLSPSGTTTISLPNTDLLAVGDYTLIEVTGTLGGSAANFDVSSPSAWRTYTIAYQSGTPNKVVLTVAARSGFLTWTGNSGISSNVWDIATSTNWLNGGVPAVFNNGDAVIFDDIGSTNPVVNLTATVLPAAVIVNSASDYTFTNSGGGGLGGSGTLTKLGNGQLNLRSANTYSGGTTIGSWASTWGGTILLFDANALGTGALTMNGGWLWFGADVAAGNGGRGVTNDVVLLAAPGNVNTLSYASKLSGRISGPGNVDWNGFSSGSLTLSGDNSGWSGGFKFTGSITLCLGHTNALGSGPVTMWAGILPVVSAAADLSGGLGVTNAIVMSGNSLTINLTNNLLLSGPISGSCNLVKSGSATLILGGNNSFTGNLTISNGTLFVNSPGSLATGSVVAVNGGGMLGGNGTINGTVTVMDGGTLAPGSPLGTLTFSNSLTLAAGCTNIFEISHSPLTNDVANISGALTNGGTLIVTNVGATALAAGDTFQLFSAASYHGGFASVFLPVLPTGLGWNTNDLNTSGAVSVVVTAKPVIGSVSISGDSFVFAGTGGVANGDYYLLASTNIATPVINWTRLVTNQFDDNGNFNFTNAANTNSMQSFYRLQIP